MTGRRGHELGRQGHLDARAVGTVVVGVVIVGVVVGIVVMSVITSLRSNCNAMTMSGSAAALLSFDAVTLVNGTNFHHGRGLTIDF